MSSTMQRSRSSSTASHYSGFSSSNQHTVSRPSTRASSVASNNGRVSQDYPDLRHKIPRKPLPIYGATDQNSTTTGELAVPLSLEPTPDGDQVQTTLPTDLGSLVTSTVDPSLVTQDSCKPIDRSTQTSSQDVSSLRPESVQRTKDGSTQLTEEALDQFLHGLSGQSDISSATGNKGLRRSSSQISDPAEQSSSRLYTVQGVEKPSKYEPRHIREVADILSGQGQINKDGSLRKLVREVLLQTSDRDSTSQESDRSDEISRKARSREEESVGMRSDRGRRRDRRRRRGHKLGHRSITPSRVASRSDKGTRSSRLRTGRTSSRYTNESRSGGSGRQRKGKRRQSESQSRMSRSSRRTRGSATGSWDSMSMNPSLSRLRTSSVTASNLHDLQQSLERLNRDMRAVSWLDDQMSGRSRTNEPSHDTQDTGAYIPVVGRRGRDGASHSRGHTPQEGITSETPEMRRVRLARRPQGRGLVYVTGRSGGRSGGNQRGVPVLPSRVQARNPTACTTSAYPRGEGTYFNRSATPLTQAQLDAWRRLPFNPVARGTLGGLGLPRNATTGISSPLIQGNRTSLHPGASNRAMYPAGHPAVRRPQTLGGGHIPIVRPGDAGHRTTRMATPLIHGNRMGLLPGTAQRTPYSAGQLASRGPQRPVITHSERVPSSNGRRGASTDPRLMNGMNMRGVQQPYVPRRYPSQTRLGSGGYDPYNGMDARRRGLQRGLGNDPHDRYSRYGDSRGLVNGGYGRRTNPWETERNEGYGSSCYSPDLDRYGRNENRYHSRNGYPNSRYNPSCRDPEIDRRTTRFAGNETSADALANGCEMNDQLKLDAARAKINSKPVGWSLPRRLRGGVSGMQMNQGYGDGGGQYRRQSQGGRRDRDQGSGYPVGGVQRDRGYNDGIRRDGRMGANNGTGGSGRRAYPAYA